MFNSVYTFNDRIEYFMLNPGQERGKKAQQLRTNWEAGFASDCIERGTNLS
jgi:hypothetical protein